MTGRIKRDVSIRQVADILELDENALRNLIYHKKWSVDGAIAHLMKRKNKRGKHEQRSDNCRRLRVVRDDSI